MFVLNFQQHTKINTFLHLSVVINYYFVDDLSSVFLLISYNYTFWFKENERKCIIFNKT